MNGLSGDAYTVLGILLVMAKERRGPKAITAPKPMASVIAGVLHRQLGWSNNGSDSRLNKLLQELRAYGKAKYVKGTGWVPTGSEASGDSLDDDEPGFGALAERLDEVAAARAEGSVTIPHGVEEPELHVEITFSLSRSTAKLLVKAFALDHDNHVIRRAAQGPVKESDPDLMVEADAARGIIRMICSVAEDE